MQQQDLDCTSDYVEILNGGHPSSPSLGRYCRAESPSSFVSQSDHVRISFHSDSDQQSVGFELWYMFQAEGVWDFVVIFY